MLVICTKTGLTYARKFYREGEVFILTGTIEGEYKDLSSEAWIRKQKKVYSGEVVFRKPTSEELIEAIKSKQLDPGSASIRGQLSKKQLRIALDYAESKEQKKITGIRMLREGLDIEIEDAPEEKAEVIKAPEEKAEVIKAPEKEAEAPKEEVETPEEEVEAPPEEPVKEPEKKDKKKDK